MSRPEPGTAGSSPRMRGALVDVLLKRHRAGIIPAYAGSTDPVIIGSELRGDHPRVCGEHAFMDYCTRGVRESSPRMRGAQHSVEQCPRQHGLIPAYAGSTIPRRSGSRACRDHPRVCGEHFFCMYSSGESRGSSPRMRGARTDDSGNASPIGIIPAYAGSTGTVTDSLTTSGDHPRVCGEHHATRPSPPTP